MFTVFICFHRGSLIGAPPVGVYAALVCEDHVETQPYDSHLAIPPSEKKCYLPDSIEDADEQRAAYQNVPLADLQNKIKANGTAPIETAEPVEPSNPKPEDTEKSAKVLVVDSFQGVSKLIF